MLKSNAITNFQTFNDKMIISTSRDDKKILLWDENTVSVIYTYEDANMKSFISKEKLFVIGKDLYSEYILALQENKSLMSIWKTATSECAIKCSPIDERITSLDISSNNKLIFISTETGVLFIYELFSGNLINSVSVSTSPIFCVKSPIQDGGVILILCQDYIKLFTLENLINKKDLNNDYSPFIEVPNYDALNKFIYIQEMTLICFYSLSKNKIVIYSFPSLKIIKNIYIHNNQNSANILTINNDYNILYATFDNGNIFSIDLKEILNSPDNTHTFNCLENIFPIIQTETKINTVCVTHKNILTGMEDGKIIIWNKFNFKKENTLSVHKGGVTNILFINRPISQYGLNFNVNIEETVVKSLKKATIGYNNLVNVKNSVKNEDYIESLLNNSLFNNNEEELFSSKKEISQIKNKNNLIAFSYNLPVSSNGAKLANKVDNNNFNLDDNIFLRKKLNELYGIINKD